MLPGHLVETLFCLTVAAIVYHHVGYPVLLHRLLHRPPGSSYQVEIAYPLSPLLFQRITKRW
jgi:hypothetical protein